jgi:hypothetical protein
MHHKTSIYILCLSIILKSLKYLKLVNAAIIIFVWKFTMLLNTIELVVWVMVIIYIRTGFILLRMGTSGEVL